MMSIKTHLWCLCSLLISYPTDGLTTVSLAELKDYADIYKELSAIPELKGATIVKTNAADSAGNTDVLVEAIWNVKNIPMKEKLRFLKTYLIKNGNTDKSPPIIMERKVGLRSHDASGEWSAAVLQDEHVQQLFFAATSAEHVSYIDLKELDLHGKIYSDPMLSALSWSPDSSRVVYVAEKKKPKSPSFFSAKIDESAKDSVGDEFLYLDDWGDQMDGQHQSAVFVADVWTKQVQMVNIPPGLSPGQIQWVTNDSVIGLAYLSEPYRLGLVYCAGRESVLFRYVLSTGQFEELTERGRFAISPRVSPDGTKVAYISGESVGTHARSAQLLVLNLHNKESKVGIDYVKRSTKTSNGGDFYGLDSKTNLPSRCWSKDGSKILFTAYTPFYRSSYVLDEETLELIQIPYSQELQIHAVKDNWVLFSTSSMTQPDQLIIAKMPGLEDASAEPAWKLAAISNQSNPIPESWHEQWSFTNPVAHPQPKYSNIPISVIYCGPVKKKEVTGKRPLIVVPHGGPQAIYLDNYYLYSALFVKLGYSVILPNYRGSLGHGKDGIESLQGHIGTTDVQDVYQSILEALKRYEGIVDSSRIFLYGGSHGGFLSLSLSALYPELFRAAAVRNPVTDLIDVVSSADFPDWAYIESGFGYNASKIASYKELEKMRQISPITLIKTNTVPTAFFLGAKDRRIPHSQGLQYHKILLAQGTETKAFVYDDNHPLRKVGNKANVLMNAVKWFKQHEEATDNQ